MGNCACLGGSGSSTVVPKENIVDNINSKFRFLRTLGEGASCEVQECKMLESNNKVALKRMTKNKMNKALFEKEVSVLKQVEHENIIKYIDCYMDADNYYIATALCSGGELFDRIVQAQKFTEKLASKLVRQMLLSVEHCHEKEIAHRDLKPENFVFESKSKDSSLRLIDFGCARQVTPHQEYHDIVGTPYYLAPEYLKPGKRRTGDVLKAADVWAVGVICFILVTGQPPFNGKNNSRIFLNIVKQSVKFPKHAKLSDPLKDFILTLLNKEPNQRPTAKEALQHPWVSGKTKLSDEAVGREVLSFLSQFKNESRLKKALADVVIHYAPKKDIEKLEKMFRSVDNDGDGEVTVDELAKVLEAMGYYSQDAKQQAAHIMQQCDDNGDGKLSFKEFTHVHASMQLSSDDMLIHTCFSVMDENGDGSISVTELQDALKLKPDEAKIIFEEADLNGDGVITFDEFKHAMSGGLKKNKLSKSRLFAGFGQNNIKDDIKELDLNGRESSVASSKTKDENNIQVEEQEN